jgi:tetratricopeptide (TPR) repeat protein
MEKIPMMDEAMEGNQYSDVVSLVQQASLAIANRNQQGALVAYTSALDIAQQLKRSRLIAALLNRMGLVLQMQGEIQDAVIAYESALRALEKDVDLNLAQVTRQLSQVSKGYAVSEPEPLPDLYGAQVAESVEADETDPTLVVKLWLNVGNAYLQQPQENPALNAYEQALQRPEIQASPLLQAYVLANIGEIDRRQDRIDDAAVKLNQAIQLFDQQPDPLEKRRALALLASIARDRNQIDQAIDLYQQAIALYQQANDQSGMGKTYAVLASLYLKQKRYSEAEPLYQQALAIAETEQDQDTLWLVYWGLGCCQYQSGDGKAAIASFEQSLERIDSRQQDLRTDEGKVAFLENVQEVFEKLLTVHLELAQAGEQGYEPALAVAERARGQALQDLMQGRERQHPRLVDPQAVAETASVPTDEPLPTMQPNLDFANSPVQMAVSIPVLPNNMVVLAASEIDESSFGDAFQEPYEPAQSIPALPLLTRLVFYSLSDRTAVFVATPDGQVRGHVVAVGDAAIAEQVMQLRRALQVDEVNRGVDLRKAMVVDPVEPVDFAPIKLETVLQNLYAEFVAPVADALPADGSTIVIEPHCSLWLVPFAALQLADGTWMGDRWSLLYAPSAQTLEEIRQEPPYAPMTNAKLLAVGNPIMPTVTLPDGSQATLSSLPGAEAEVEAIAQLFPAAQRTLLIQAEATEAAVKQLALSHNIVHLATHGLAFGSDPLASLVALAPTEQENGLLTAREVIQSASLPADLVVLSACQTGLGKITGEGMLGLSRAFLVAGARSLLVSQWSVSDSATKELMVAFYQHYLEHGNKAIALQQAMKEVRFQPDCSHPRYWAAFVVVGAEV